MVCHVGYYNCDGTVCIYDTDNAGITSFKVPNFNPPHDFDFNWELLLETILFQLKGKKLGCCCAFVRQCKNDDRKKLIKCGLRGGFKKVEIIDDLAAGYLILALQTKYKFEKGDIIWVLFPHKNIIFKKVNGSINMVDHLKFSNKVNFDELFSETKWKPNIIFIDSTILWQFARKILPSCIFTSFVNHDPAYFALIKARKMANDPKLTDGIFNTELLWKVSIKQLGDIILEIEAKQPLPISKSFTLKNKYAPIVVVYENAFEEEIAIRGTLECRIHIDKNGIFSITKLKNAKSVTAFDASSSQNQSSRKKPTFQNNDISVGITSKTFTFPSKFSINNDQIEAVGIDLGTSRCCAAVNRRSGIETVALDNTNRLLPSYVAYDEAHDKCGLIVVNNLKYNKNNKSVVFDSKRLIVKTINDIELDSIWPFSITNLNNRINIRVLKCNKETELSPEEVSASLLKNVKEKCEQFQGKSLSNAVITIPAVFTESQQEATLTAAAIAGWETVELLPEPIAASFAYFIERPIPNQSIILLFDLGGGTLDICISKIENDEIQIISQNGDSQLGGRDFDKILINYLKNLLFSDFGISTDKKEFKLLLECQILKENLSSVETTTLPVDEFDTTKKDFIEISRAQFNEMTLPLLNRIKNTILTALFLADYKPHQIQKVLQVGGGSRMPMIKNLLEELFPHSEHCCAGNPDEVVAVGAAHYAYSLLSS